MSSPGAPVPHAATPTPVPNPQASAASAVPTAPAVAAPNAAATAIAYDGANPVVNLPTVGLVASQVTLPAGLVPDGTPINITVSASGAAAGSVRNGSRGVRAIQSLGTWTATIDAGVPIDPAQMNVTIASSTVNSAQQRTITYLADLPSSQFTLLGSVASSPVSGNTVTFAQTSPCSQTGENSLPIIPPGIIHPPPPVTIVLHNSLLPPVVMSHTAASSGCATSASTVGPLAPGVIYVQDPGASSAGAVLAFPAGANGNAGSSVIVNSAPSIATDFAGELFTAAETVNNSITIPAVELRPYGSTSVSDSFTVPPGSYQFSTLSRGLGMSRAFPGVGPLGANVWLLAKAFFTHVSGAGVSSEPDVGLVASVNFDRAQGGFANPFSTLGTLRMYSGGSAAVDTAGNVYVSGAYLQDLTQRSNTGTVRTFLSPGLYEFTPGFGAGTLPKTSLSVTEPFRSFQTSQVAQSAVDADGNVYLASPGTGVLVYGPRTGGTGVPAYTLPISNGPNGIAVDSAGYVYVTVSAVLGSDAQTIVTPAAIQIYPPITQWSASVQPVRTIAGSGTGLVSPGQLAIVPAAPSSSGVIQTNPTAAMFTAAGQAQAVTVTESGYNGGFTQTNSCAGKASLAPTASGFTVTAVSAGTCFANIADAQGNKATVGITVTTTGFTINGRR